MGRPRTHKTSRLNRALAALRETLGMSQQQMADALGVSLAAVAMAETTRTPTVQMIARVHQMVTRAAATGDDGSAILTAKQREHDDVLYRHLVQHSEAHRFGLAAEMRATAHRALVLIAEAAEVQQTPTPTLDSEQTAEIAGHLRVLDGLADLLDPLEAP